MAYTVFKGMFACRETRVVKGVRCLDENFVEEKFGIPYRKKVVNRSKQMCEYYGCLMTEDHLRLIVEHYKGATPAVVDAFMAAAKDGQTVNLGGSAFKAVSSQIENMGRIYSDGGSINNGKKDPSKPEYGAYGVVVTFNGDTLEEIAYGEKDWTNNIGELSGAIRGLECLINEYDVLESLEGEKLHIVLCTDSQYVSKGCTEWIEGWIKRGWKNNEGKPTPNRPLWERMKKILDRNDIELYFRWVRGHTLFEDSDSVFNERCDTLASEYLKENFAN